MIKQKFKKEIASLEAIFAFLAKYYERHNLDDSVAFPANFSVEEIFTNMVKYSPESKNDVLIKLDKKDKKLTIILTDYDVKEFDIKKTPEVDVEQNLKQRKVGGLGLHLTKKMMDEVNYRYENKNSIITLVKHLEN